MDPLEISKRLKAWAREAGFDRAAVARLGPAATGDHFRAWLARGDQAAMSYLERRTAERSDPRLLLPGARSALCVTLRYHPLCDEEEPDGDLWPRVARYAHGDDYHLSMEKSLRALAVRIHKAFPGCATRPYVDTGPVLERDLAAAAGLGAVGKNTLLLHPEDGSWFLIGEILLTLDLAADPPLADLCGTCSQCLEACPTGALTEPYRLDSRRCISYWTIEYRGSLPEEIRPEIGDWVFGCDICQEVCPLNHDLLAARQDSLRLPAKRAEVDLAALVNMPRDEYVERFRRSPMKRAKLEGLQRNAAVVMGNRRSKSYLEPLGQALQSAAPASVRGPAAWALGRIGGEASQERLLAQAETESDPDVLREIRSALRTT